MQEAKSIAKDPICGMSVEEASALHADRDGQTYYFCSKHCRDKFLTGPVAVKPEGKPRGCCGS